MTDQTHAQLRERIAALIDEHVIAVSMSDSWLEGQEEAADAIIALLSPPDPGLASVLEEALELLSDSAKLPPKDPAYHDVVKRLGSEIGFGAMMSCATLAWRERLAEQGYTEGGEHTVGHTRIVVERLIERIRAALTSGGWREGLPTEEDAIAYAALIKMEGRLQSLREVEKHIKTQGDWLESRAKQQADALSVDLTTPEKLNAARKAMLSMGREKPLPNPPSKPDTGGWRDGRKSTGMRDEEGREIFEGDWVQFNVSFFDGNFKDEPISGKIVYVPELMSFQLVNVQSDYWREYTGGDDSTYQPFSELNFSEADFRVIEPPLPNPPSKPDTGGG